MRTHNIILSAIASAGLSLSAISAPAIAGEYSVMASAEAQMLYSGAWSKKSFKSSGEWSIYTAGGKTFVKLSSDFKTRKAPDLKIFLSPRAASDTNGKNATDGSVLIARLSSNAGEQIYEIPESIDVTAFKSILIHCEQYSKLWSAADLAS